MQLGFWEKACLIIIGLFLFSSVIVGGCVYLHKAISSDAVDAYKLKQAETANEELIRVTQERDDAYALLSAQTTEIYDIQGDNAPAGPRVRYISDRVRCDRDPADCPKGFISVHSTGRQTE